MKTNIVIILNKQNLIKEFRAPDGTLLPNEIEREHAAGAVDLPWELGDYYNEATDEFEDGTRALTMEELQDPVQIPKITLITHYAFWRRVTKPVRVKLLTLAKTEVEVEVDLLSIAEAEYIDLEDADLIASIKGFQELGLIEQEDYDRILADGTEKEVPQVQGNHW